MNNQDKIKAKIEQNKIDQEAVAEKGRKLEAELEFAKKPELRHGDYGCNYDDFIHIGGATFWLGRKGTPYKASGMAQSFADNVTGNLADDLKRNSEDLREFTIQSSSKDRALICCVIASSGNIHTTFNECGYLMPDQLTELVQKGSQMLATIRRDNE